MEPYIWILSSLFVDMKREYN